MDNLKPWSLDISKINKDWIKEMAEISYWPCVFVWKNSQWNIVAISKDSKDGSWGIPKWKVDITEQLYIEDSNNVTKRELEEESWIDLNDDSTNKLIYRLPSTNFDEVINFKYKEWKDTLPEWKEYWDTKEIVNKRVVIEPIVVAFELNLLNKLLKWYTHNDTEKQWNSVWKSRTVKLIPFSEINDKLKKEQVEPIQKLIDEFKEKLEEESFSKYIKSVTEEYKAKCDKIHMDRLIENRHKM